MANDVIEKQFNEIIPKEDIEFLIKFDDLVYHEGKLGDIGDRSGVFFIEKGNTVCLVHRDRQVEDRKPFVILGTKALKEQGLYESFAKDVWVKGSVRWQIEYEND